MFADKMLLIGTLVVVKNINGHRLGQALDTDSAGAGHDDSVPFRLFFSLLSLIDLPEYSR